MSCPDGSVVPPQDAGLPLNPCYARPGKGVGFGGEFVVDMGKHAPVKLYFVCVRFDVDGFAVYGNVGGGCLKIKKAENANQYY